MAETPHNDADDELFPDTAALRREYEDPVVDDSNKGGEAVTDEQRRSQEALLPQLERELNPGAERAVAELATHVEEMRSQR